MAEKIIKARLFTWFRSEPSAVDPDQNVRTEKIAHLGERVDVDDAASLARGEELGAFYTDEEAKQIEEGTYRGADAEVLTRARAGLRPQSMIQPIEGEGAGDTSSMSAEDLGDYIAENRLNVADTVALAGDDEDSINKVLDAENYASGNDPRKGVVDALEAKLAAAVS